MGSITFNVTVNVKIVGESDLPNGPYFAKTDTVGLIGDAHILPGHTSDQITEAFQKYLDEMTAPGGAAANCTMTITGSQFKGGPLQPGTAVKDGESIAFNIKKTMQAICCSIL